MHYDYYKDRTQRYLERRPEDSKMLEPQKLEIIKNTLPIVKQHGEEITKHFYKRMFNAHPELLNIFNQTYQITGY